MLPRLAFSKVFCVTGHIISFVTDCLVAILYTLGSYEGLMLAQLTIACVLFVLLIENIGSLAVS